MGGSPFGFTESHDIDFTLAIDRDRLPALFQAVTGMGYTVPEEYCQGWVDRVAGMPLVKFRLYLEGKGIDIDIFLAESSFQRQLLARRRNQPLDGLAVWFVSPEDLILLKLLAGRPRDMADVGDILFTQGRLDESYMRLWAESLGVLPRLEQALADPLFKLLKVIAPRDGITMPESIHRALSIRQPFAELILLRKKTKEYRSWRTNILGERVFLYASAKGGKRVVKGDEGFFRQRYQVDGVPRIPGRPPRRRPCVRPVTSLS